VCLDMAMQSFADAVEVSCDRAGATLPYGSLVHASCPLIHTGVKDPATGLHSHRGYKMVISSRMLQYRVRQVPIPISSSLQRVPHSGGSPHRPRYESRMYCICFEATWSSTPIELPGHLRYSPMLCSARQVDPGPDCIAEFPKHGNPRLDEEGRLTYAGSTQNRYYHGYSLDTFNESTIEAMKFQEAHRQPASPPAAPPNALTSLGEFVYYADNVHLGRSGLQLPPSVLAKIEDEPFSQPFKIDVEDKLDSDTLGGDQMRDDDDDGPRQDNALGYSRKYQPTLIHRHKKNLPLGWEVISCPHFEHGTFWLLHRQNMSVPVKCNSNDRSVGDRVLIYKHFAANAVTVLGRVIDLNGALGAFRVSYVPGSICDLRRQGGWGEDLLYIGTAESGAIHNVPTIMRLITEQHRLEITYTRTASFLGSLLSVWMAVACMSAGCAGRASLQALSAASIFAFAFCTTLAIISAPVLICWMFPNPVVGLTAVGTMAFGFYGASSILQHATERSKRLDGSLTFLKPDDGYGSSLPSPYTTSPAGAHRSALSQGSSLL